MYQTFDQAIAAARCVIAKTYGGNKLGCCVTECSASGLTWYGFRFHSAELDGKTIQCNDGTTVKFTAI